MIGRKTEAPEPSDRGYEDYLQGSSDGAILLLTMTGLDATYEAMEKGKREDDNVDSSKQP